MIMDKQTNDRYNTISAALNIIDPEGTYVPGTMEYNWVTESILSWMAEMEPDEVFRMSEDARNVFKFKRHTWQQLKRNQSEVMHTLTLVPP